MKVGCQWPVHLLCALLALCLAAVQLPAREAKPEAWRLELRDNWRALQRPPITPYHGPFGGDARAFEGSLKEHPLIRQASFDWGRYGTYRESMDPRPINREFEKAILEEWRRMGYNTAYNGNVSESYLAEKVQGEPVAWNVLENRLIEEATDGQFDLPVPPHRGAVFYLGRQEVLEPIREAQAALLEADLSVPQHFVENPELNE